MKTYRAMIGWPIVTLLLLSPLVLRAEDTPLIDTEKMMVVMYVRGVAAAAELGLSEEQVSRLNSYFQSADTQMLQGRKDLVRIAREHAETAARRPLDEEALDLSREALRSAQAHLAALREAQYEGVAGILTEGQLLLAIRKARERLDWAA